MTSTLVHAVDIAPQAWRNGGGQTRELLCWPAGENWAMRVSLADIARNGPFSSFAGVTRWFVVVQGAGVLLGFGDEPRRIVNGDPPLCFDGAQAPTCRLIDGATRDLNLMVRDGDGAMRQVQPGVPWQASFDVCALFTAVAGTWSTTSERKNLPAHTLLWRQGGDGGAWQFEPDVPTAVCGWWMGASLRGANA